MRPLMDAADVRAIEAAYVDAVATATHRALRQLRGLEPPPAVTPEMLTQAIRAKAKGKGLALVSDE